MDTFLRTVASWSPDRPGGGIMQYLSCGHRKDDPDRKEPEPRGTEYHCAECEANEARIGERYYIVHSLAFETLEETGMSEGPPRRNTHKGIPVFIDDRCGRTDAPVLCKGPMPSTPHVPHKPV